MHPELKKLLIDMIVDLVGEECTKICRRSNASLFRQISIEKVEEFAWSSYISELERKCPVLLQLLTSVVSVNDIRNSKERTGHKKKAKNHNPGICTAIAILLKERNREMCGVQTYLSLVLFSSHVQKKVRHHIS